MNEDREFLFNYGFADAEWGIRIHANDPAEAKEKIKAVGMARYEGEVAAVFPFSKFYFGWLPRLLKFLRATGERA